MGVRRLEPEGFDWASGSGGAAGVRRVLAEATEHDHREALNEAAQLTLRNHGLDTAIMLLDEAADGGDDGDDGAGGADGAGGFAYVHGLSGLGRPELDLVVHPDARGQGVGTRLAQAALDALGGIPVTAWSHGDHPAAARLAATLGFAAVRSLWLMRRDVAVPLPEGPLPDGMTMRLYREADATEFLAINAEAFASHPEQGALDARGLAERMAEDWFDPTGLFVAENADGRLAGFHWTKRHPDGVGEVYVIGVAPAAQGSGLGRALLVAGLEYLAELGVPEVVLYVESDNAAAVRLYEKFGFTHRAEDTDVMYAPED